jgi:hypothetical protein
MRRELTVSLAAAVLAGCGGHAAVAKNDSATGHSPWVNLDVTPEPGFDPYDPALQTDPDDNAQAREIVRRAGRRSDFKVPASAIAGLEPGPLVRAVALRPFYELEEHPARELRRLNRGQRAVCSWPEGRIPRDRAKRIALLAKLDDDKIAKVDDRYAATQYKRKTALANVLAPYIRTHRDEFVAR